MAVSLHSRRRSTPRGAHRRPGRPAGGPLYLRIAEDLRRRILRGELRAGARLPGVREQARRLSVNRMTVAHAYRALARTGHVRCNVGSGTVVAAGAGAPAATGPRRPEPARSPLAWEGLENAAVEAVSEMLRQVETLEAEAARGRVTFERAVPDPALIRVSALRDALTSALAEEGRGLMEAGPAAGHPELRRAVAKLLQARGLPCSSEQVLIVNGVQQALDLILRTFCEPGESVILDDPAYYRSLLLFRYHRLHLMGLPMESEEGGASRASQLETLLAERPARLLYTVCTFHNPTGISHSREERLALLEASRRRALPIVEDDSLWELRYRPESAPPLAALDDQERVLYVGSFSKILSPGLRLGWVVGPSRALQALARVKEISDVRGTLLTQAAVARMILGGQLESHLRRSRSVYRERRDAMAEELRRHFPKQARWEVPEGGLTFWVSLPPGCDTRRLLDAALAHGVSFCPGTLFRVRAGGERQMRLAFGHLPPEEIERGLKLLGGLAGEEVARAAAPGAARLLGARASGRAEPLF